MQIASLAGPIVVATGTNLQTYQRVLERPLECLIVCFATRFPAGPNQLAIRVPVEKEEIIFFFHIA